MALNDLDAYVDIQYIHHDLFFPSLASLSIAEILVWILNLRGECSACVIDSLPD